MSTLITGWICSGIAFAQAPDTLFISTSQVVHLRFASELKYVNLGNKSIVARIVDGSKDFVALKAREPFSDVTSLSCLENNGRMHTFLVAYREHPERLDVDTRQAAEPAPPVPPEAESFSFSSSSLSAKSFDDIASMPRELYHLGCGGYDIAISCDNIFVADDVLYIVLSLENRSAVSYALSDPRFSIESRKRTRRGLQYEKAIFPRRAHGLGTTLPDTKSSIVFTFDKVALTRGQVLRIYFYENSGSRNFVLTLGIGDVNKAKRLN